MTIRKYLSTSQETALTSAMNSSQTTMVVNSAAGLLGSITPAAGETFTIVIDPDTSLEEIVDVVAPSNPASNTLTIVRAIDGTAAIAHSAGAKVRHMAIGRDFREANTHQEGNLTQHAATTSAQLASVITDETGTGSLVFGTNPTIVTPTIASFANANHNHLNGAGGGSLTSAAISDFTEAAQDVIGTSITGGTQNGITVTYNDAANVYNFDVNDPVISIDGDVAGSATMTNLGNTQINVGISPGVIVNADISGSAAIAPSKIAGTAVTQADTGTVTSAMIANGTIATVDIADSAITTAKIADGAITSAKIADGAIVTADLADGSVTSAKIADGAIVNADINAAAAIDKTKIAGTAITAADTGTVTSAMILDGTIVDADVSGTAAIAKGKLNLGGTITSADLVDETIVNADISPTANIALSKLAVDPLARANHTGTQTASTISNFDTQVRTSRLDQMAAPTAAVSANSQKITNLATPTNPGDAVSLGYLDGQKGVANGIAPLDGTGKVPIDHIPASAIAEVFVVSSQSAMLALSGAGVGDIAVRTDLNKSFILQATPASTLGNWVELLTPTDAVLSVDGLTGAVSLSGTYLNRTTGQLLGNLNANTFTVTNLGTPTNNTDAATKAYVDVVAGSASAAAASAAAAAASYDSFDDRYLGAKSTPPTLDNDGNALVVGAIYWNTVQNAMFAWTGSAWGSISSTADLFRFRFTATAGQTSASGVDDFGITLSYLPGKEQVYLNGNLLARTSDYNATSGNSITSLAAMAAGDILEIISFTSFEVPNAIARTIFDNKGDILVAPSADTAGILPVGSNGQVLTADSTQTLGVRWSTPAPGYTAPTIGSTTINSGATVTTISGLTLSAPTLSGTVTASGDINLTAVGAVGSINDEFALIIMGAI